MGEMSAYTYNGSGVQIVLTIVSLPRCVIFVIVLAAIQSAKEKKKN